MYQYKDLIGKIVTIRSIWGNEYVTMLLGFADDTGTITVTHPQTVATEGDNLMLVPFAATADAAHVSLHMNNIFAIMETREDVARAYQDIVKDKY